MWQKRLGRLFDIGTLYTVLAGLLNLLVIYDAWAGPMHRADEDDSESPAADRVWAPPLDERTTNGYILTRQSAVRPQHPSPGFRAGSGRKRP